MKIAIFNPEHDLCLAHGSKDYVAPASAQGFAHGKASVMAALCGCEVLCLAADEVADRVAVADIESIAAWGWNATLKQQLLRQGVREQLLPDDRTLAAIRRLSHRATAAAARLEVCPEEPLVNEEYYVDEIEQLLKDCGKLVLKAPWSGAGRGLRWIDGRISEQDSLWVEKVVRRQGSVLVEEWQNVELDFAAEYMIESDGVEFLGYSLFRTERGHYYENLLLSDDQILDELCRYIDLNYLNCKIDKLESWLGHNVCGRYEGPLGVDMFIYEYEGGYFLNPVVEFNFRYTMGHVALAMRGGNPGGLLRPMGD